MMGTDSYIDLLIKKDIHHEHTATFVTLNLENTVIIITMASGDILITIPVYVSLVNLLLQQDLDELH